MITVSPSAAKPRRVHVVGSIAGVGELIRGAAGNSGDAAAKPAPKKS